MKSRVQPLRPTDWASIAVVIFAVGAAVAFAGGRTALGATCAVVALGVGSFVRSASRRHPGPMPYYFRWLLYLPRWPLTPARLGQILEPRAGERVLELGPGVGIYSLPIAEALRPSGALEALDVQPEMLAALRARARAAGIDNLALVEADAQRLPYADASFDAAYLVSVLGEIPDPSATLRELRRVLKPSGRLVVGEMLLADPDGIRLATLREMAERAGFTFERQLGPDYGFFARFQLAR